MNLVEDCSEAKQDDTAVKFVAKPVSPQKVDGMCLIIDIIDLSVVFAHFLASDLTYIVLH